MSNSNSVSSYTMLAEFFRTTDKTYLGKGHQRVTL